ncbi:tyrosine--tRNA ligase [Salibacterium salarium]|uniref:Tyrosine--tRNA ligase n=1 Tax=Salibacterium salarium TaxID=284579 RepID=A0A3R9QVH1_9BACI|nr:tyrosine--tRNA ligase [Salibacterium salarium]RSL34260.1 tyrosine--tRNA ligase [Salibacterium salarium]
MDILQDLKNRGLVNQVTDEEGLQKLLNNQQVTLYCGFDPTGDSLHVGHLLTIITLRRFQLAGHKPLALVGGATGLIGDPSGKKAERTLNEEDVVRMYTDRIKDQLQKYLDFEGGEKAEVVNNYDWIGNMSVTSFLRDVGKHFSLNYMLSKESVDSRIQSGISFTEFSYQILQSLDFNYLFDEKGCQLQIGGSDQWGNITAGLELIRRSRETETEQAEAYGFTIPLVTKADGEKFGKSEGGAIWLDSAKTSPYEFYQFLINTDDRDVVTFIRYFTFLTENEIKELEEEVKNQPEQRTAQRRLAEEVTTFVHGEEALQQAQNITQALFGREGNIKELTAAEIEQGFKDVPAHVVEGNEIGLVDLLVEAGIVSSKRQAREDVTNGAVYINGDRCQELDKIVGDADKIDEAFTIIRRGKKKYFLIQYN